MKKNTEPCLSRRGDLHDQQQETISHRVKELPALLEGTQDRCIKNLFRNKKILALWISALRDMRTDVREVLCPNEKCSFEEKKKTSSTVTVSEICDLLWNPAVLPLPAISNLSHNYPVRLHLCSCLYHNTAEAPSKKGKICRLIWSPQWNSPGKALNTSCTAPRS